ncbi:MAG TPA: plastocyanin/azurin family copper-binding protein [Acidimicrobiales bacterium]|nr:plastocyanin/azurin family copper-binding protein [Acidimicrobiales bacterium]
MRSKRQQISNGRRWPVYSAMIVGVLGLSACGGAQAVGHSSAAGTRGAHAGPSHPRAANQHVTIVGNDQLRFDPSTVHVQVGTVVVTLKDSGAYPHNIVVPGLSVTSQSVSGDPGGMTTSFTLKFKTPGHYPFYCQYHQAAGMTGVFVVS